MTVHSRQYSPAATAGLVELESAVEPRAFDREHRRRARRSTYRDDRRHRERDQRAVTAAAREVALGRAGVAGLLGEPAQPVRDLRLVLRRGPAVRLAVRAHRRPQGAHPDAGGREVPPRPIGGRGLAQLDDRLPVGDRAVLVVQAVARLAQPEQRRGRDGRVVEPDDADVMGGRRLVLAGMEEVVRAREEADRGLARQRPGATGVGLLRGRAVVVHRGDDTGAAAHRGPPSRGRSNGVPDAPFRPPYI